MYLKQLYIENNGPLRHVRLELPFHPDGNPKPIVLVGGNGSGKTTLLSVIADAMFSAAAVHYSNVFPKMSPVETPFFRIVGGQTVSLGDKGSISILQFVNGGETFIFKEKGGKLSADDAKKRIPDSLKEAANWPEEGAVKEFNIQDSLAGKIFDQGIYVYFPSSRAEIPHWLNQEALTSPDFKSAPTMTKELRKPIFVERGLQQVEQWLLSVILEARFDLVDLGPDKNPRYQFSSDSRRSLNAGATLMQATEVLRRLLGDENAQFFWLGRQSGKKLGIESGGKLIAPSLSALSAGQSTLLATFGTILSYGDSATSDVLDPSKIVGICLVDELDAHMHVDLQHRAVPSLVRMFPKIQFIVSSHSPLLVFGMEKEFGPDGIVILDMPSGTPISAEAYAEFARALEVLQDTKAFAAAISEEASRPGKMLVLLEGETDPAYLQTAAELHERAALLEKVELSWVGAKDPKSGNAFHTGKDALNQTLATLRANPDLVKRDVLLLYDQDANKPAEDYGQLRVRSLPSTPQNTDVEVGIESLLPQAVFTPGMYNETQKKKRGGGRTVTTTLNKTKLCDHLCREKRDPEDFVGFIPVLDMMAELSESSDSAPIVSEPSESKTD